MKISIGIKMKKTIIDYIKNNIHIIILFISLISVFLFNFTYLSILITIVSSILTIIFSRKHIKILIITIVISISVIIADTLVIFNNLEKKEDVYKDKNVLIGSWIYNEYGGTYVFKEDFTYIQYSNTTTDDNYCKGTYKYSYGASGDNDIIIRQDENYYYYTLTLNEESCTIMNKEIIDKYKKNMVFSLNKYKENEIIMMNKENNNIFQMTKKD